MTSLGNMLGLDQRALLPSGTPAPMEEAPLSFLNPHCLEKGKFYLSWDDNRLLCDGSDFVLHSGR